MKVVQVSRADEGVGGGFRAAHRLHRSLRLGGVDDWMWVSVKGTDEWAVVGPRTRLGRGLAHIRPTIGSAMAKLQGGPPQEARSVAVLPSGVTRRLNRSDFDVVNLHWINGETLSIEEIGGIRKPLVWTMHDMWPFSGAEHYSSETSDARWVTGYKRHNRGRDETGLDIDRWVFGRKVRSWRNPIRAIAPSRWLRDCIGRSALMHRWPVHHIPNPLDTQLFRPLPRDLARDVLGLPQSAPLILFGAYNPCADARKGFDLLQAAVERLDGCDSWACAVMGQSAPKDEPQMRLPIHWLGRLHDNVSIVLAYSAASVVVVPSRQDNLPQVATEAQACGVPVVAFNTGGLGDVVEHLVTGYLARSHDPVDLANGIRWVLEDEDRRLTLAANARERALRLWSPDAVVPQYLQAYALALEDFMRDGHPRRYSPSN